jgi:hypothetical protein
MHFLRGVLALTFELDLPDVCSESDFEADGPAAASGGIESMPQIEISGSSYMSQVSSTSSHIISLSTPLTDSTKSVPDASRI